MADTHSLARRCTPSTHGRFWVSPRCSRSA
jgi:hypothetical protein